MRQPEIHPNKKRARFQVAVSGKFSRILSKLGQNYKDKHASTEHYIILEKKIDTSIRPIHIP